MQDKAIHAQDTRKTTQDKRKTRARQGPDKRKLPKLVLLHAVVVVEDYDYECHEHYDYEYDYDLELPPTSYLLPTSRYTPYVVHRRALLRREVTAAQDSAPSLHHASNFDNEAPSVLATRYEGNAVRRDVLNRNSPFGTSDQSALL